MIAFSSLNVNWSEDVSREYMEETIKSHYVYIEEPDSLDKMGCSTP